MELARPPYVTAGVALAAASLIAVAPPPLPDVQVPAVQLTATSVGADLANLAGDVGQVVNAITGAGGSSVSPITDVLSGGLPNLGALLDPVGAFTNAITTWGDVSTTALANASGLGQEILANPAPILSVVIGNQIAYAEQLAGTGQNVVTGLATQLSMLPSTLQTAFSVVGNLNSVVSVLAGLMEGWGLGDASSFLDGIVNPYLNLVYTFGLDATIIDSNWLLHQFPVVGQLAADFIAYGQIIGGTLVNEGPSATLDVVGQIPGELASKAEAAASVLANAVPDIGAAAIGPVNDTIAAADLIGQGLVDSVTSGDLSTALTDLLTAPAVLINGALFQDGGSDATNGFLVPFTNLGDTGLDALVKVLPELAAQAMAQQAMASGVPTMTLGADFAQWINLAPFDITPEIVNMLPNIAASLAPDIAAALLSVF